MWCNHKPRNSCAYLMMKQVVSQPQHICLKRGTKGHCMYLQRQKCSTSKEFQWQVNRWDFPEEILCQHFGSSFLVVILFYIVLLVMILVVVLVAEQCLDFWILKETSREVSCWDSTHWSVVWGVNLEYVLLFTHFLFNGTSWTEEIP